MPLLARPQGRSPSQSSQFVTYTCASGETAGSGTVAWFDKDGKVISITQAKASGATLTAGPAPDRTKAYEWRSAICIPPPTTTTAQATTTTAQATTTTAEQTTTSSTTSTTVAPTTTTLPGNVFTGTVTLPADGDVPTIWGGFGTAPKCPAGTRVDWAASTVDAPADVQVVFFPELNDSVVLFMPADPTPDGNDWFTRTISYRIVCV